MANTVVVVSETETVVISTGEQGPPGATVPGSSGSMADGTTITPSVISLGQNIHINTQAVGTLTVNAPTGTPADGQKLVLRIKSTNIQTFTWNAIYRGSVDLALPTTTTGGGLTDYYAFIYNATDVKWDYVAKTAGF